MWHLVGLLGEQDLQLVRADMFSDAVMIECTTN